MPRRGFESIVRVATAVAIVAAVAGQLQYLADAGLLRTVNFFSFFTIQSNILACLVLLGLDTDVALPLGRFARAARGAATLAMAMTGIIYAVLLAPIAADVSTQLELGEPRGPRRRADRDDRRLVDPTNRTGASE